MNNPNKKNILIFEDSSKAKFGGGQKVTLNVIETLYGKYNLSLFDVSKTSYFYEKARKKIGVFHKIWGYGKTLKSEKSSFSIGFIEIFLFPFFLFINFIKLSFIIKNKKFNSKNTIIYVPAKKNIFLAYFINLFFNIGYIFHAHTFDNTKSIFYKLMLPALRKTKKIICVSKYVFNNLNINQCEIVFNSIIINNKIRPKSILNKEKIIVASFSTLIKIKGIKYFMQSYKHLNNKNKIFFYIFGEGNEMKDLKQYENDHVMLKGFAKDVAQLMKETVDILVSPSVIGETFSLAPLEALSFGIPVITTDIGGQAEIIKDNELGFLVPKKNAWEIAKKIEHLTSNPNTYGKMSQQALEYSKNFSYVTFKNKILDIFENL